ncbi:hypothetical protein ACFUTU_12800 [Arthrobacter sp. NPDC057388]|uniref:hypothetical protein n=1 Tax=Arthrobacter sp. NPDC057388 TaxID=3346116 RepID=UPI0036349D1E
MAERPIYRLPPAGWSDFGAHVDRRGVRLEFSAENGEDGMPLWERPINSQPYNQEILP